MKKGLFVLPLVLTAMLLLAFQNCSKDKDGSYSPDVLGAADFESKDAEVIDVAEGDDVNINLSLQKFLEAFPNGDAICTWHYKSPEGEIIDLQNAGREYILDNVQKSEGGRFRISCTAGSTTVVVIFVLVVKDPVVVEQTGKLVISVTISGNTVDTSTDGLTKTQAQAACDAVAAQKIKAGVKCVWNGQVLLDRKETSDKKANFTFFEIHGDAIATKDLGNMTEAEAIAKCDVLAAALEKSSPKYGYRCVWDGKEFKKKDPVVSEPQSTFYFHEIFGDAIAVKEFKNLTRSAANKKCDELIKALAKGSPNAGYKCLWNNVVIKQKAAVTPKLATLDFHEIFGDAIGVKQFKNISEQAAIAKCDSLIAALLKGSPKAGYKCIWSGKILKQKAPVVPTPLATFDFHTITGDVISVEQHKTVSEASAVKTCEAKVKILLARVPTAGYKCVWGGKVLKQKAQDVPKGTYLGYFINNGVKRLFIETKSITQQEAYANCKLNHSKNQQYGVLCTWNGKTILEVKEPVKPKLGLYRGYFVDNGKERLFIETKNISEADALANCKKNHANNPKSAIKCVWENKTIFSFTPVVVKLGLYQGYFVVNSKLQNFITTKDISEKGALENCKLNAKNNPKKTVVCKWEGKVIYGQLPK